jgi:1,4-alpha-glucan branching enzyme
MLVAMSTSVIPSSSRGSHVLGDWDLHLFNEGSHLRLWEKLGARVVPGGGGVHFAVWAPNAASVSIVGDFNGWQPEKHPLAPIGASGIWAGSVAGLGKGAIYKYHIASRINGYSINKMDPFGFMHEVPPKTASVVWDLDYQWRDAAWMRTRASRQRHDTPMSIYEMHVGSWRRVIEEAHRSLTYRELAPRLADYLAEMGFTHVEFLPVMEHPLYRSWGYQTTGYFAPTSRFGTPQDFMFLVDALHQREIGVILDWVPSHFPTDEHALGYFDGTHLFEHADPQQGFHPDWKSAIFNYGRHEVRSFLLSSAMFWLDVYHADGLRVDAVASMLYLDYSRQPGEWIANKHGGNENLDAIEFLRRLNKESYAIAPGGGPERGGVPAPPGGIVTIAEESTAWPMVSRPAHEGGLGFGFKWDMGWMHDTLKYLSREPIHRKYHHNQLTFRTLYQFSENYVMPLSHDEVVHMKGSLANKMPGDDWQKFANLRLLYANQWLMPGKKLLFMGGELAQWSEFSEEKQLDWTVLEPGAVGERMAHLHGGVQRLVKQLNALYRHEAALFQQDCEPGGFEWVYADDAEASVVSFLRWGKTMPAGAPADPTRSFEDAAPASGVSFSSNAPVPVALCIFNYTPVPRFGYRVGVPDQGVSTWTELLNTDAEVFGGTGQGNMGRVALDAQPCHGRARSLVLTLPPLSAIVLKPDAGTFGHAPG